jgi:CheY-like chemotaxis protein
MDRGGDEPEEVFFDFVYQPLFEEGAVSGIAAVCFEVTELAKARRTAEAANLAKDEFLAMLGHELRNPLAPIMTALQLMNLRGLTGGERERSIIERQVKHVVRLVDDLLDVSRITRGKVQLRREYVEVADVMAKAIEMTSPAIEERRHTLEIDVPRGIGIDGDPARLAQVFGNLLTNAAKYTDPGGAIRVSAAREGEHVVVRVADTGRGIAREMLPHVFDLFVQGRQDLHRAQGGLGIGLAVVRSLVESHDGRVTAHSAGPGAGSTFTVQLPAAIPVRVVPTETPAGASPVADGWCRVLIVDDNEQGAELLADSLRALGYTVDVAFDGPTALQRFETFQPDVALLDLGLPVMDGFELADRLRVQGGLDRIPLIAVTGYAQALDRERTATSGFRGHLAKPVDVHVVDEMIRGIHAR